MNFSINNPGDISKLLAFIRVLARGEFKVKRDVIEDVLLRLQKVAKEQGINIKIISPSGERIIEFTMYGVIIGAAMGYLVANIPGALVGAALGGTVGRVASNLTIVMDNADENSPMVTFKIG